MSLILQNVSLLSRYLDSKSASLSQSIDLSYSHGDFQASNILLNDSGNFLISDWEDFAYRSTTYDFFIYYSGIRQSSVKPTIWFNFSKSLVVSVHLTPNLPLSLSCTKQILTHSILWWLEDTLFRIQSQRSSSQKQFSNLLIDETSIVLDAHSSFLKL